MSPDIPSDVEGAAAHLLLDCADEVRDRRLRDRGWDDAAIADAMGNARQYRRLFDAVVRTDDADPHGVADRILAWVRSVPR